MIALLVRLAIMVRVLRLRVLFATIQRVTVRLELEELADCMERNAAAAEGAGARGAARDLRRHADRIRAIVAGAPSSTAPSRTIAPGHARNDHHGDGPCAACEPARPHVLEAGKLRPAAGDELLESAIVFDQVGHVIKSRYGSICADRCSTACRAGGRLS